jgi:hypothetical protein
VLRLVVVAYNTVNIDLFYWVELVSAAAAAGMVAVAVVVNM